MPVISVSVSLALRFVLVLISVFGVRMIGGVLLPPGAIGGSACCLVSQSLFHIL